MKTVHTATKPVITAAQNNTQSVVLKVVPISKNNEVTRVRPMSRREAVQDAINRTG